MFYYIYCAVITNALMKERISKQSNKEVYNGDHFLTVRVTNINCNNV
jgi:hypothetical protein